MPLPHILFGDEKKSIAMNNEWEKDGRENSFSNR
jgi:hypothetical protein